MEWNQTMANTFCDDRTQVDYCVPILCHEGSRERPTMCLDLVLIKRLSTLFYLWNWLWCFEIGHAFSFSLSSALRWPLVILSLPVRFVVFNFLMLCFFPTSWTLTVPGVAIWKVAKFSSLRPRRVLIADLHFDVERSHLFIQAWHDSARA